MAKKQTGIGWCDYTINPYGWHCNKVSPGCKNCYMFGLAKRYNRPDPAVSWSARFPQAWKELNALPSGVSVFLNDMSDTYHERASISDILSVHRMAADRQDLSFVIVTKRPERALELDRGAGLLWPDNLWLMVTVETQAYAHRITTALKTGAAHVAVSAEPILGPVDFDPVFKLESDFGYWDGPRMIEWIITGGESGNNRRPAKTEWFRDIRDFCQRRQIAFYHKQGNGLYPGNDRVLDGKTYNEIPNGYHLAKDEKHGVTL